MAFKQRYIRELCNSCKKVPLLLTFFNLNWLFLFGRVSEFQSALSAREIDLKHLKRLCFSGKLQLVEIFSSSRALLVQKILPGLFVNCQRSCCVLNFETLIAGIPDGSGIRSMCWKVGRFLLSCPSIASSQTFGPTSLAPLFWGVPTKYSTTAVRLSHLVGCQARFLHSPLH